MNQKLKRHLKKHQVTYSCLLTGVGVATATAGITCLIMRSNIAQGEMCIGNARGELSNTASFSFGNKQVINLITVIHREGPGHPGYPCVNVETGHVEPSIREMAKHFNIPVNLLYGHLKGKFENVDGLHFKLGAFVNAENT